MAKKISDKFKSILKNPVIALILLGSSFLLGLWLLFILVLSVPLAFDSDIYDRTIWLWLIQILILIVPLALLHKKFTKQNQNLRLEIHKNNYIEEIFFKSNKTGEIDIEIQKVNKKIRDTQIANKKTVFFCLGTSYFLFCLNAYTNFILGWINLSIIGTLLIYAYYRNENLYFTIQNIKNTFYETPEEDTEENIIKRKNNLIKSVKMASLILLLVNVNWVYQIEKNENNAKRVILNEFQNLIGEGWCKNNELASDGAGGFYTYGGWPCITIGRLTGIKFQGSSSNREVCATVWFNRQNDGPGSESYSLDFTYEDFCIFKKYGEYSTFDMKEKMYDFISPKLDDLQTSQCNYFYYRLTEEDKIRFCRF